MTDNWIIERTSRQTMLGQVIREGAAEWRVHLWIVEQPLAALSPGQNGLLVLGLGRSLQHPTSEDSHFFFHPPDHNPTTSIICFLLTPWSEVKSATVGLFYPVAAFQWWIGAGVSGSGFVTPNCVHPLALAGDLSACAVSFPPASLVNTGSTSLSLVPWLIINSQFPTHIPSTTTLALLSIPEPYTQPYLCRIILSASRETDALILPLSPSTPRSSSVYDGLLPACHRRKGGFGA